MFQSPEGSVGRVSSDRFGDSFSLNNVSVPRRVGWAGEMMTVLPSRRTTIMFQSPEGSVGRVRFFIAHEILGNKAFQSPEGSVGRVSSPSSTWRRKPTVSVPRRVGWAGEIRDLCGQTVEHPSFSPPKGRLGG